MSTRSQVLENRRKWIDFLKLPDTQKHTGSLESSTNHSARCCLGHACHVLVPETRRQHEDSEIVFYGNDRSYAPIVVMHRLGLKDCAGGLASHTNIQIGSYEPKDSLAAYNDGTEITPQEIGAYLETVIEGGEGTPFHSLSSYPE